MRLRLNPPTALFFAVFAMTAAAASVSTVVITMPAAAPTNSPSYADDGKFQAAMLDTHNLFRKEHNATDLSWNDTLATFAANWTKACEFEHSVRPILYPSQGLTPTPLLTFVFHPQHGPYGENLAQGYGNASAAAQAWGDERAKYNFAKAEFSEATGHFTQMVWKDTKTVGCGRKKCGSSSSPSW